MNWINISEINEQEDVKGVNILVWQNNLSDPKSSRFQRGVFFEGDNKTCSFIKIYPGNRNYFKEDKDWKSYDLEGDMCQITHFAIVDAPTIKLSEQEGFKLFSEELPEFDEDIEIICEDGSSMIGQRQRHPFCKGEHCYVVDKPNRGSEMIKWLYISDNLNK